MSLEQLKLNKQLITAMEEAGFTEPKEIQSRMLSRMSGGQDLIAVGPEGCGKTTTLVLGVLMKLKYAFEVAPRAMIMVPSKEAGLLLEEQFRLFKQRSDIRVLGLYPGSGMEGHKEQLAEGVDIVIGTPDRIESLYIKSSLNITQIKMFILDDAELIVKQGFHTVIKNLTESLPKCQHIVFTELVHDKLNRLMDFFMNQPATIEILPDLEPEIEALQLYHVPNFKTKLNLLNVLMRDAEAYPKVVVFANTKTTADKLYKSLNKRIEGEVCILKAFSDSERIVTSIYQFAEDDELRVLVVPNEGNEAIDCSDIPFILHFDLPLEKDLIINRLQLKEGGDDFVGITFSTDIELSQVKKTEQALGVKMTLMDLPPDLVIEGDTQGKFEEDEPVAVKPKATNDAPVSGGAFHKKKESNMKDYNYSYKDKRKMSGKVSKRRNS